MPMGVHSRSERWVQWLCPSMNGYVDIYGIRGMPPKGMMGSEMYTYGCTFLKYIEPSLVGIITSIWSEQNSNSGFTEFGYEQDMNMNMYLWYDMYLNAHASYVLWTM